MSNAQLLLYLEPKSASPMPSPQIKLHNKTTVLGQKRVEPKPPDKYQKVQNKKEASYNYIASQIYIRFSPAHQIKSVHTFPSLTISINV